MIMSRQQLYCSFAVIFMALVTKKYYDLQRNYDVLLNSCMEKLEKAKTVVLEKKEKSEAEQEDDLESKTDHTSKISQESHGLQETGTSVVCMRESTDHNICHFKNLCYSTSNNEFIIFISDRSILVDSDDLNEFSFSSVEKHNFHYHSFIELPASVASKFNITFIESRTVIFNRFKPDNIMHVFHDDILPLHITLKIIDFSNSEIHDPYNIQLLFMEDSFDNISEHDILYEIFSLLKPMKKKDLEPLGDVLCFRDAHAGLSKSTLWYQYGFFSPQGPIAGITTKMVNIRDTTDYILQRLEQQVSLSPKEYIILLSRKETRKILNEEDLIITVARNTGMRVLVVSIETHSLSEMIELVSNSKGIVGMHGSLLILALFLSPGCTIVELFPYAINPSNYTPFKTLAGIKNINLVYRSWRNEIKENSFPHPDFLPEMGGISHLPKEEQISIKSQEDVPKHLCCADPSWLYHIYQDTVVDSEAVSMLILESLNQEKSHTFKDVQPLYIVRPGQVRNVMCKHNINSRAQATLNISWSNPGNLKYLSFTKMTYDVLLQAEEDEEDTKLYIVSVTHCTIPNLDPSVRYLTWVRCVIDGNVSSYSKAIKC